MISGLKRIFIIILILSNCNNASAVWENRVYKENIETVYCHNSNSKMDPPVIMLNSGEQLVLEFDDLNSEETVYFYKVIHCTWDWETSDIRETDYMKGFPVNEIYDYTYSFNTRVDYIHYALPLPNQDFEFVYSGNYIIKVFEDNDPSKVVLTRRIMVYEQEAPIDIRVKASSVVSERDVAQEVDFTVGTGRLNLFNVYDEIHTVVMQNMRWDNAKMNLQPKFMRGSELIYDHEQINSFNGGNEYRYFDLKNLEYQSDRIARIFYDSAIVRVFLHPDEKRTFKRYVTWEDLDGNFLIKKDYSTDSDAEADYVWVYFTLPFDFPLQNAALYVAGRFTDYTYSERYEMKYDFAKRAFKGKIFLKQGYYNYAYMLVNEGSETGQIDYIEGNHFQTQNTYQVMVYYRDSNFYYDRLVGVAWAESH